MDTFMTLALATEPAHPAMLNCKPDALSVQRHGEGSPVSTPIPTTRDDKQSHPVSTPGLTQVDSRTVSVPSYGTGPAIGMSLMHPIDAVMVVDTNGRTGMLWRSGHVYNIMVEYL